MSNGIHPKGRYGLVIDPFGHGLPCTYCQREMIAWTDMHPTRDHVVPVSRGGTETVLCCYQCNQIKSDSMPDEWAKFMRDNPAWWTTGRRVSGPQQATKPRGWVGVCPAMLACSNALFYERYKNRGGIFDNRDKVAGEAPLRAARGEEWKRFNASSHAGQPSR